MIDWLRREALEPVIALDDRELPIEIIRNRRARRLTLRLAPDGSAVRITLPHLSLIHLCRCRRRG